ncbi:MAG: hypothetical protein ACOYD4_13725 [Solirubrobacterales bacterium]
MGEVKAGALRDKWIRVAVAAGTSTWLLGIVVGLCSWISVPLAPSPAIDASWVLGLQMALSRGFHFGSEVLFTYGPLGFLQVPIAGFSPYAQIGAIYALAVQLALGLTLVWAARRAFGLWLGVLAALVAAMLLSLAPIVAIALTWSLVALGPGSPALVRRLFSYVAGPLAAIEVLDKLSIGPLILAIGAITVVAMEGRRLRNALLFLGTFLGTFFVLWFALGQGLSNLDQFARSGYEIAAGYSAAMAAAAPNDETSRILIFAAMVLASLLAGYVATRRLPASRRVGVGLVLLLTSFGVWKMAFVRFGPPTMPYLFAAAIPVWLAFPWRQIELPGSLRQASAPLLALLAAGAIAVIYFPVTTLPLSTLDPTKRVETEVEQLSDLLLPGHFDDTRDRGRRKLIAHFPLDLRTLSLLRGQTVSVDQADIAIAWAYGLDWRPLPVFQAYAAYNPYLDRQNREALLAADGPSRILRVASATPRRMLETNPDEVQSYNRLSDANGGMRAWNQPQTTLAMLCDFRPLSTSRAFQVLERSPDRCGTPRRIGSTEAGWGEEIQVPPAPPGRQLVYADVEGLAPSGWEKLRTALYRAPIYTAVTNDASAFTVQPELDSQLLLSASPGADFPAPFALSIQAATVRFEREGTAPSTSGLKVSFFAVPVGR